jgi:hypothetical protein
VPKPSPKRPKRGQKLRVGYFSSDFGNTPVGRLMASVPLLHSHAAAVAPAVYALNARDGSYYRELVEQGATVVPLVGLSNEAAAQKVAEDGVHILVVRPAPLRPPHALCSSLANRGGYGGTAGSTAPPGYQRSIRPAHLGCATTGDARLHGGRVRHGARAHHGDGTRAHHRGLLGLPGAPAARLRVVILTVVTVHCRHVNDPSSSGQMSGHDME